jgi:hypothetical protein
MHKKNLHIHIPIQYNYKTCFKIHFYFFENKSYRKLINNMVTSLYAFKILLTLLIKQNIRLSLNLQLSCKFD